MKLKKHIPSKKAFDHACAQAACECPQVGYKGYLDMAATWGNKDNSRAALLDYWAESDVLWESGYARYLPDDAYNVLAKYKRLPYRR